MSKNNDWFHYGANRESGTPDDTVFCEGCGVVVGSNHTWFNCVTEDGAGTIIQLGNRYECETCSDKRESLNENYCLDPRLGSSLDGLAEQLFMSEEYMAFVKSMEVNRAVSLFTDCYDVGNIVSGEIPRYRRDNVFVDASVVIPMLHELLPIVDDYNFSIGLNDSIEALVSAYYGTHRKSIENGDIEL